MHFSRRNDSFEPFTNISSSAHANMTLYVNAAKLRALVYGIYSISLSVNLSG